MARTKTAVHAIQLADLQSLHGRLREGDYWSALRTSSMMLNSALNPETVKGFHGATSVAAMTGPPMTQTQQDEYETVCGKLAEFCEDEYTEPAATLGTQASTVSGSTSTPAIKVPQDDANAAGANITANDVIAIVQVILNLIAAWRARKGH